MIDLRAIRDYCEKHYPCIDCEIKKECERLFDCKQPHKWNERDLRKLEKEVNG